MEQKGGGRMKCPMCDGRGSVYNALGNFYEDCGHCQGTGKVRAIGEPMTNEDWFCSLSTEEKARALANEKLHFRMLDYDGFVEWLKEKHE